MVASATPTVIKKRKKKKSNRRKPARPVDHSGRISTISCACVLPPPRVFRLIISFLGEKKKKRKRERKEEEEEGTVSLARSSKNNNDNCWRGKMRSRWKKWKATHHDGSNRTDEPRPVSSARTHVRIY